MIGVLRRMRMISKVAKRGLCLLAVGLGLMLGQPASAAEIYAAYIIDVSNGNVLFSRYADDQRYPASLTKIMTLYLVFEDLEAGRINLNTPLKASQNAANQAPSKLGLRPGETITVDQAIRALVTKSANDVAVVIAENLSGSVSAFADRMTRTARSIGMTRSRFVNPHGLPDTRQVTTASDMAKLAIQTMRRFPNYYGYYQTRSFTWKGATFDNHNKLLGRVNGVDGLKTGYIRASGFNLVTSMRRDGRHIVGVVMGGRTGASRDAHMQELLETYIKKAAVSNSMMFARAPLPPNRPDAASLPVSAVSAQSIPVPKLVVPSTTVPATLVTANLLGKPFPNAEEQGDTGATEATGSLPPAPAAVTAVAVSSAAAASVAAANPNPGAWIIQVGAFNSQDLALATLERARLTAPSLLSAATAFTETVNSNGETLWRARFSGFDQNGAQGACVQLKQRAFGCFPARN